jgi:hypothetical protein
VPQHLVLPYRLNTITFEYENVNRNKIKVYFEITDVQTNGDKSTIKGVELKYRNGRYDRENRSRIEVDTLDNFTEYIFTPRGYNRDVKYTIIFCVNN